MAKCINAVKGSYGWRCSISGECPVGSVYINSRLRPCQIKVNPKPKLKRVKAWAYQYRDRNGDLKWYANEHKATMPVKNLPVIILIDEKYLKGKEKKK